MKEISINEKEKEFLKALVGSSSEGLTINDVRKSLYILDAIEKSVDSLAMDNEYFDVILLRFNQAKFQIADKIVIDLYDRIESGL